MILRTITKALVALGLLGLLSAAGVNDQNGGGVKAALTYKAARFVEWPESAFSEPDAPIVFAVLGEGPFAAALAKVLKDKTVHGRATVLETYADVDSIGSCHVLFVTARFSNVEGIRKQLAGSPVLLVGDTNHFAHSVGHINYYRRGASVRFEINDGRAKADGLRIDAKLLKLARIVRSK